MKPLSMSTKLSIRELCALSLLGGLMVGLQAAMAALPNIHMMALLIVLTAVFFGWKCLYAVAVFIMLEGLIWGFGIWWMSYWYIWPALAVPAVFMRENRSSFIWAAVAGTHGLLFGALSSLPYFFIGGAKAAFSYWVAGIPFDLAHCAGNFTITLLLFRPLYLAMSKVIDLPEK